MNMRFNKYIQMLIFVSLFSFIANFPLYGQEIFLQDNSKWQIGKVTEVNHKEKKMNIEIQGENTLNLKVTDSTRNVISNRKTDKHIRKFHAGQQLFFKHHNEIVEEFFILHRKENEEDVMNFIYIQEKNIYKVLQAYYLGEFDVVNIRPNNQVHMRINKHYLEYLSNGNKSFDLNKYKLNIKAIRHPIGEKIGIWQQPEREYKGIEIKSADPIVYDIEELKLEEGAKIKFFISLQKEDGKNSWNAISTRELKLQIKRSGIQSYNRETVAFVRDSFGKNWQPQPGASATVGITFFTTQRSAVWKRTLASVWNILDPSFGINLTLLDFDEDKNIEIGLGPVFSILQGGIYFGVGWNLSTIRRKNRYAFFGISFTGIADKIKGKLKE